jgi:2-polyprenyl-3-methyl-5-hydroxy-6-metoxy-1,4-benzoquinol methylase
MSRVFLLAKRLQDISVTDVWDFINNIWTEDRVIDFTETDRQHLWNRYAGFGIIRERHAYYRQDYVRPFWRALRYIFGQNPHPKIFDVCCGTGSHSILFALMGARVVALDHSPGQLDAMRKRQAYYEKYCQNVGRIEILQDDALSSEPASRGPFDAVYSTAGMGHFLTAETIAGHFKAMLRPGGYLILKSPNPQCITARLFKRIEGRSTMAEYRAAARTHGFTVERLKGIVAIPRVAWMAGELTHWPDMVLRQIPQLAIHLEVVLRRN